MTQYGPLAEVHCSKCGNRWTKEILSPEGCPACPPVRASEREVLCACEEHCAEHARLRAALEDVVAKHMQTADEAAQLRGKIDGYEALLDGIHLVLNKQSLTHQERVSDARSVLAARSVLSSPVDGVAT